MQWIVEFSKSNDFSQKKVAKFVNLLVNDIKCNFYMCFIVNLGEVLD